MLRTTPRGGSLCCGQIAWNRSNRVELGGRTGALEGPKLRALAGYPCCGRHVGSAASRRAGYVTLATVGRRRYVLHMQPYRRGTTQQEKRAIGYVRVSTTEQARDGVSLDAQRARITAWCAANGYTLAALHADEGLSGKSAANRPGLRAALREACTGKAALLVYSLSRLARSTKDALSISERLAKAGADLVSLSESIDTTTAAGKMVFRMLAVLAEFERDVIAERTRAAMQHKKAKGERVSREAAYGYCLDSNDRVIPDAEEQRTVALVAELRAAGRSLRQIASALDAAGIRPRGGRRWHPQTVARIAAASLASEATAVA